MNQFLPDPPLAYNLKHEPIDLFTEEGRREHAATWTSPDRQVAYDHIDGVEISTVFLVVNHDIGAETPVLYETAVYGKGIESDGGATLRVVKRYATREEAEAGHQEITESWRRVSADLAQQEQINHEGLE